MSATGKPAVRWNSLDCLKGIACIAVVLIHYNISGGNMPAWIGACTKAVCRFAVPVFLCISGFFFVGKSYSVEKTVKKLKHILKLALTTGIFYAVYTVVWNGVMHGSKWDLGAFVAETITGDSIIKLLLTHDPFEYSHLWYLIAMVWCYVFMLLVYTEKRRKLIYLLGPVLLAGYACMQEFRLLTTSVAVPGMESRIFLFNSFLFRALPFFIFGMIFREYQQKVEKLPLNTLTLAMIVAVGVALELLEWRRFGDCQFYVGSYMIVFAMMVFAIKHPQMEVKPLVHLGRDLSMNVYIFHIAVGKLVDIIGKYARWWGKDPYYIARPLMVLVGTLLLAEVIFQVKKQIGRIGQKRRDAQAAA